MENLEIKSLGLMTLSTEELTNYNAGHHGLAYDIGHFIGETIVVIGAVAGIVALILVPKP